jgi:hypothetical protein
MLAAVECMVKEHPSVRPIIAFNWDDLRTADATGPVIKCVVLDNVIHWNGMNYVGHSSESSGQELRLHP